MAAALLVTTPTIFAGGWAGITMDSLPERIRAGGPHGRPEVEALVAFINGG